MQTLLVFALALLIAVLLSGLAHRSILSTALLRSPLLDRAALFHTVALVTLCSIVVHSTTDFLVAAWFSPGPKEARRERTVESVIRGGT